MITARHNVRCTYMFCNDETSIISTKTEIKKTRYHNALEKQSQQLQNTSAMTVLS